MITLGECPSYSQPCCGSLKTKASSREARKNEKNTVHDLLNFRVYSDSIFGMVQITIELGNDMNEGPGSGSRQTSDGPCRKSGDFRYWAYLLPSIEPCPCLYFLPNIFLPCLLIVAACRAVSLCLCGESWCGDGRERSKNPEAQRGKPQRHWMKKIQPRKHTRRCFALLFSWPFARMIWYNIGLPAIRLRLT